MGPGRGEPGEGNAAVYCEGAFGTTYGKTAHGLVRRSERYRIVAVIDSGLAGRDAGEALDGRARSIPIVSDLSGARAAGRAQRRPLTHFVVGVAPDGGRLSEPLRRAVLEAVGSRLHVVSGLHDFLSEDEEIRALADRRGVTLRDVRKPPPRAQLHFFSGKIEEVESFRVAVLGTDSAVGKRTTAWWLVDALSRSGVRAELVGTGQTAWMQGARYGVMLDALVNDFVTGEIEHAVWWAWQESGADVLVIEGQGSLLHPAYPGGLEILAAGRPQAIVLQHVPGRRHYDGFPQYLLHPLRQQIEALECVSARHVLALTVNPRGLDPEEVPEVCLRLARETGLPCLNPGADEGSRLAQLVALTAGFSASGVARSPKGRARR